MDGKRFDNLTKALAAGASRRSVLKALGGGAGVAAGVLGGQHEAGATPETGYCHQVCQPRPKQDRRSCYDCCLASYDYCESKCGESPQSCVENCLEFECSGTAMGAAPDVVWRALIDSTALAAWVGENDVVPEVGRRFQLRASGGASSTGAMTGEVIAVEPERRLVFTWQGGHLTAPTTVAINLEPVGDGSQTRLRLEHAKDPAVCRAMALLFGRDWQTRLFAEGLPRYLAQVQRS